MRISSEAIRYLTPGRESFWKWDKDEAVSWSDGKTITFIGELRQVLEHFSDNGLPSLDCIFLSIAATRSGWLRFGQDQHQDRMLLSYLEQVVTDPKQRLELISDLDKLHDTVSGVQTAGEDRKWLLSTLLGPLTARCSIEDSEDIREFFEQEFLQPEMLGMQAAWTDRESTERDLLLLGRQARRMTIDRLRAIQKTSIEEPVAASEETQEAAKEALKLIEAFLSDAELSGIGSIAKMLLGILYREPKLGQQDDAALGGLSDISNRGNLDRLLISELAQDNDVLAIRVASNEALYLRRDPPRNRNTTHRHILIESGIRMWGLPRLFATSIAMSLAALSEPSANIRVWRAGGGKLNETCLWDRTGVETHLMALETDVHPGDYLASFLEKDEPSRVNSHRASVERFLIVARDSWEDSEFQSVFASQKIEQVNAIVVDRSGNLEVIECRQSGSRTLKRASLDLRRLVSTTPPEALVRTHLLPKIFDVKPFPLRQRIRCKKFLIASERLLLGLTDDHRLVLWNQPEWGAIQVSDRFAAKRFLWAERISPGESIWCLHRGNLDFFLTEVDSKSGLLKHRVEMNSFLSDAIGFRLESDAFIAYWKEQAGAYSLADGSLLASIQHDFRQIGDVNTFRTNQDYWKCIQYERGGFSIYSISFPPSVNPKTILYCIQRRKEGGFIGITDSGAVYLSTMLLTSPLPAAQLTGSKRVVDVNKDGSSFCYRAKSESLPADLGRPHDFFRILEDPNTKSTHVQPSECWVIKLIEQCGHPLSYRKRFDGVGYKDAKLVLVKSRSVMTLEVGNSTAAWTTRHRERGEAFRSFDIFQTMPNLPYNFRVERAQLGDTEIFLDGRGFLHLRCDDPAIPELSLVLKEGDVSGWTSDGCWFGDRTHCGTNKLSPISALPWSRYAAILDACVSAKGKTP